MSARTVNREVSKIGRLTKHGKQHHVVCAACGTGKSASSCGVSRKRLVDSLRAIGWANQRDGRWRCPRCEAQQTAAK